MAQDEMKVRLRHLDGFRFEVDYGDDAGTTLGMDEPAPLGEGTGPNAGRVLASAVANCLAASLVFCLSKRGASPSSLEAEATVTMGRNEENRIRIQGIRVDLHADVPGDGADALEKCRRVFEDFCIVTQSVKSGIPVEAVLH